MGGRGRFPGVRFGAAGPHPTPRRWVAAFVGGPVGMAATAGGGVPKEISGPQPALVGWGRKVPPFSPRDPSGSGGPEGGSSPLVGECKGDPRRPSRRGSRPSRGRRRLAGAAPGGKFRRPQPRLRVWHQGTSST